MTTPVHRARQAPRAFTLLEILVATSVLALILLLTMQATDGILTATGIQSRKMDSAASARRVMDILASDLRHALTVPGAAVLVPTTTGDTLLALVTSRRGPDTANDARHLAIAYTMDPAESALLRRYTAVPFSATDLPAAAVAATTAPAPPIATAEGILAVRLRVKTLAGVENLPPVVLRRGSAMKLEASQFLRVGSPW